VSQTGPPDGVRKRSPEIEAAYAYAREYYGSDAQLFSDWDLLIRHCPSVFVGYITLRKATFTTGPEAVLSPKFKELVILAIELALTKVNAPPVAHARLAIEAGATPAEVAEVVSLSIPIGGVLTYLESGRFVLRQAEAQYATMRASSLDDDDDDDDDEGWNA
jgi:alkylhydroperoxidase/carboxymuconolactone decarboxylase family protein YurZ